jgi:hypothetical protein
VCARIKFSFPKFVRFLWQLLHLKSLSTCRSVGAKAAAGKRQDLNGKPPPRLSMVYGDDVTSDRVFNARESVFSPGEQLDADSADDLYHGEESPLPDQLLARHKQGRELPVRAARIHNLAKLKCMLGKSSASDSSALAASSEKLIHAGERGVTGQSKRLVLISCSIDWCDQGCHGHCEGQVERES